jgi:hypothetical protein
MRDNDKIPLIPTSAQLWRETDIAYHTVHNRDTRHVQLCFVNIPLHNAKVNADHTAASH